MYMCVCVCVCVYVTCYHLQQHTTTSTYTEKTEKRLNVFKLMLLSVGIMQFKIYHCSGNSFSDMRIRHKIYKSRNYGRISAYV